MISRSEVMKEAHRVRRSLIATYAPWQFAKGIKDCSMSYCLKVAWSHAKAAAAKAPAPVLTVEQKAANQLAIMTLEAKSFRYSIRDERAALLAVAA